MIDDDILSLAKIKAQQEKISVGKALNLLARLGLNPPSKSTKKKNGLPVFDVKDKGAVLTPDMIFQDEEY